jgi:hypothetical protein
VWPPPPPRGAATRLPCPPHPRHRLRRLHGRNAAYEAKRVLGYTTLVDATPTRDHIVVLREAGVGLSRITQLTGIARQTIQAILRGRPERGNRPAQQVKRDTAERILALDPVNPDLAAGTPVDATGARRRIQALVCAGWSFPLLAERGTAPQPITFGSSREPTGCT